MDTNVYIYFKLCFGFFFFNKPKQGFPDSRVWSVSEVEETLSCWQELKETCHVLGKFSSLVHL